MATTLHLASRDVHVDALTVPVERPAQPEWGSDVTAEMLRRLGIEYVALNPGASYRGVHDSLVNYNGNVGPSMILCNHEEVAVAIAHGYYKASGKLMATALHSNVGLMHGTMGLFDAWADRVPVFAIGGTGPMDSVQRRPWIDWIHTANNQGGLVRDFTKLESQPSSIEAIPESMLRAWHVAMAEPRGPVYVCFDAGIQEERIAAGRHIALPDISRYPLPAPIDPPLEAVRQAARWLVEATYPVILLGRGWPTAESWATVVALAETLGAAVLPDPKCQAAFPSDHHLHLAGGRGGASVKEVLSKADVVLSLDHNDVEGMVKVLDGSSASRDGGRNGGSASSQKSRPRLIHVSLDEYAVRSWTTDFQELPAADLPVLANADRFAALLLEEAGRAVADNAGAGRRIEERTKAHRAYKAELEGSARAHNLKRWDHAPLAMERVVGELRTAIGDDYADTIVARTSFGWPSSVWEFTKPQSYLGTDGGGGVGSGPGIAVGAALAAKASGRPVVAFCGDGDLLMAPTALWTAAHHRIPLLIVVANNRSYYNDEEHQDRVARARNRPPENRWVGQRIDEPGVDFATLATGLGAAGFGPVHEAEDLPNAFQGALEAVRAGGPAVVDVHITPR